MGSGLCKLTEIHLEKKLINKAADQIDFLQYHHDHQIDMIMVHWKKKKKFLKIHNNDGKIVPTQQQKWKFNSKIPFHCFDFQFICR